MSTVFCDSCLACYKDKYVKFAESTGLIFRDEKQKNNRINNLERGVL